MVSEDVDWVWAADKEMVPVFEGFDDGQHFKIMDQIVGFCSSVHFGEE